MTALRVQNARTMHTMTSSRSKSGKLAAKPGQIESSVDLPHQMIVGDRIAKMKLVEQLTFLQTAHHGSTPPRIRVNTTDHRVSQSIATKSATTAILARSVVHRSGHGGSHFL